MLARIIEEHGLVGTPVGSLAVSCAAVNDVLSWIALALALAAADASGGEVAKLAAAAVGLVLAPLVLAGLADRQQRLHGAVRLPWWLSILLVGTGLAAASLATSEMGLHYVFGAFAFGFVFARPSLAPLARTPIRAATWLGLLLLPLYLVLPGATTNFRDLDLGNGGEVLLVLAVAATSKLVAGGLSARATGLSSRDSLSVGVLLNTRGLVELVALGIGLSAGLRHQPLRGARDHGRRNDHRHEPEPAAARLLESPVNHVQAMAACALGSSDGQAAETAVVERRHARLRGEALAGRRHAPQQHGRGRVQARRPRADLPQVHLRRVRGQARRAASRRPAEGADPEDPDEYRAASIFWVPKEARWSLLRESARQPTIGKTVDDAMIAIERDNPSLKGVLPKDYARPGLDKERLGQLIDLVSRHRPRRPADRAKDMLGRVYEYFLSQFASAEGKKGGQFYTPSCVVRVLVEMLAPYKGRVYDPCCGSGGMFVQSEKFIEAHGGRHRRHRDLRPGVELHDLAPREDEPRHPRHRRAGSSTATRFHDDRHPDLKADYVLANPPFNDSDWRGELLRDDKRWKYGVAARRQRQLRLGAALHPPPRARPASPASCSRTARCRRTSRARARSARTSSRPTSSTAWSPCPASSSTRRRSRSASGSSPATSATAGFRDRRGETLFIDARKLGTLVDRVHRELTDEDIAQIAGTYHAWRGDPDAGEYADVPGFCKSATLEEIREHGHVLTPGRYVGAEAAEDDGEPFDEKMQRLAATLREQQAEAATLDAAIAARLEGARLWRVSGTSDSLGELCDARARRSHTASSRSARIVAGRPFLSSAEVTFATDASTVQRRQARDRARSAGGRQSDHLEAAARSVIDLLSEPGHTAHRARDARLVRTSRATSESTAPRRHSRPPLCGLLPQSHRRRSLVTRDFNAAYTKINPGLRELPIPTPSLPEQRAIASVLGALDDKIELNRRMSETLEAIARALFRSWFVDFDPVRAKGWQIATLGDLASLNPESWSKHTRPEVIEYLDLSNTKWGRIEGVIRYERDAAPSRAQRVLRPRDTIVGTVRPGNGSYAFISRDGLTGSTGFAVLRPTKPIYSQFVYLAATDPENIEKLSHLADGGAYPAVRPDVVAETPVIRPSDDVLDSFSKIAAPLLDRIAVSEDQSRTLAALRDTLLPKLISGELRVGDADRLVETAL